MKTIETWKSNLSKSFFISPAGLSPRSQAGRPVGDFIFVEAGSVAARPHNALTHREDSENSIPREGRTGTPDYPKCQGYGKDGKLSHLRLCGYKTRRRYTPTLPLPLLGRQNMTTTISREYDDNPRLRMALLVRESSMLTR